MAHFSKRYQPFTISDAIFTGEDIAPFFPVYDDDGDLLDPSTWTTEFKLGPSQGAAATFTVAGTEAVAGITVTITAANLTTAGVGQHFYTLSRIDAGQNRVIAFGEFVIQGRLS